MKHQQWIIVVITLFGSTRIDASSEVPLAWSSIRVETQKFGGAVAEATRTTEGFLDSISIFIRGSSLEIRAECLPNNFTVYLNNLQISFGQFSKEAPYWDLTLGVDFPASSNGIGKYHLILLQDRVHSSYIEYPESERVEATHEICDANANDA